MFTYKAARYHAPIEDEYETLDEALKRAAYDWDAGEAIPVEIIDAAGQVVLDHDAIIARVEVALTI